MPVDDTHQWLSCIYWTPDGEEPIRPDSERSKLSVEVRTQSDYEYAQRHPDDKEVQEGQGPIAIHALENLATSDRGVVMFRRILKEQIQAVQEGRDPKGVFRDPKKASSLPTTAGIVIRTPEASEVA